MANAVKAAGFELYAMFITKQNAQSLLRILIDKPGGVNLDDCAVANKQVNLQLSNYVDAFGTYGVEISSPGVERPLLRAEHFIQAKGQHVRIKYAATDGNISIKGQLQNVTDTEIYIESADNACVCIAFSDIIKASISVGE